MKPRALLIDLSALFHPAWHSNESGPVTVAFQATIGGVQRCLQKVPTDLVAIACDGKGNWRKDLSPAYKAHREKLPESFFGELQRVKDRLRADGLTLWECPGYEADDLIATATRLALEAGHEVTIATADKDLCQLVTPKVDILNVRTFDVWTGETVKQKFGVEPAQLGEWLALVGDKSDGVAGCPGCGPASASELIAKYGTCAGIYGAIEKGERVLPLKNGGESAIERALKSSRDAVMLALDLVALKYDAPINFEEIYNTKVDRSFVQMAEFDEEKGNFALVKHEPSEAAAQEAAPQVTKEMTQKNLDEQYFYGFAGASAAPFPAEIRSILVDKINPREIEIRPDGVVYLPGVVCRRILTKAFGPGGWALLPRTKWIKIENTIAWHGVLVCLGQFVSEAVGECFYRENNDTMSLVSCIEGAKTDCLSRCCKDLGVASELWDRNFIEDWKKKYAVKDVDGTRWVNGSKQAVKLWRLKERVVTENDLT